MLSVPLNVHILRALQEDRVPLTELRRNVGTPPASTMRVYLRAMTELGAIERHRHNEFAAVLEYEITRAGEKLLEVGSVLERWLRGAPDGPIALGSAAARSAIKALSDGYSANIVRALAARPLPLVELSRFIPGVSYPTLERRLAAMRLVGLIEPLPEKVGRGTPYRATDWLRAAVAPGTAAVGWEHRYAPAESVAVSRRDVESTFLLAVPLLELRPGLRGSCRLSVELAKDGVTDFAGVSLATERGRVVSCVSRLEGSADASASGSALAWFRWINRHEVSGIELGGDVGLAEAVADGIRGALVRIPQL